MRARYVIASRMASRDADTNEVSLFSLVDGIIPVGFPVLLQDLAVLAVWERNDGDAAEYEVEFRLSNNGERVAGGVFQVDFGETLLNNHIVRLHGLVVKEAGSLLFEYLLDGQRIAHLDLPVQAGSEAVQVRGPGA